MKLIRWFVGKILLTLNWLTQPAKGLRPAERQNEVEKELQNYALYEFEACPFCVRVRRKMRKLNLPIERRDALKNPEFRDELLAKGGSGKVPCLRIRAAGEEQWMYESKDIMAYLEKTFPL